MLVCYDITDRSSLEASCHVHADAKRFLPHDAVAGLVGCKSDLAQHGRAITPERARAAAAAAGLEWWGECSAKEDHGLDQVVMRGARSAVRGPAWLVGAQRRMVVWGRGRGGSDTLGRLPVGVMRMICGLVDAPPHGAQRELYERLWRKERAAAAAAEKGQQGMWSCRVA